jgi:hypothetical protein
VSVVERREDWVEVNQRRLVEALARLKHRLRGGGEAMGNDGPERDGIAPTALDRLTQLFGLSDFERDLLLLAAGVEMDAELAALCATAAGNADRSHASFGLALAALPDPHWSALTPVRPLRRWRLVEPVDDSALSTSRLRIDERVLHYLAGVNYMDQRLRPLVRTVPEPGAMADGQRAAADAIVTTLKRGGSPLPLVQLWGNDPHGQQDVAAAVAVQCGLSLYAIAAEDLPASAHEMDALVALWEREAALLEGALLVECADASSIPAVPRFAERVGGLIALAVREPLALRRTDLRHRVDKPGLGDQQRLWEHVLGESVETLGEAVPAIASEFRLSTRDILKTGAEIAREAESSPAPDALLWRACRGVERVRLDGLAQRIEPAARWDDLVLPEAQLAVLRQIVLHVRHRPTVHERWGFADKSARGLGISALFAGDSGTGKTMAAEVLAGELHRDLFRIDLSGVVSKYIGETEKNLARVFDAAEAGGAILLFDEADALFGKRSEVKDSHDRYANLEVSYLLQRMESYRGLAILTSNQKAALDLAFQRRLRFIVQFPFPDAAQREAIWRGIFPAATPTRGLDHGKLAQLHMAGGSIRNVALNAAFFAAESGVPVGMAHLLRAAHAEAAKRERPLTDGETRGWV